MEEEGLFLWKRRGPFMEEEGPFGRALCILERAQAEL